MSYVALARKYRPTRFSELVGQDVLISTFSNAILSDRIHHAFLLTGIRGVGKTTTARIIAKNLNCDKGPTMEPCEVCSNCTSIKTGNHPDIIEFDAASNTGIEDVKIIISNAHYAPTLGRKKVFIIDEVHMLSTKAFNALLKTLEEPPENIIFIFATTEVRKVPITILSRCQKFFLKSINKEEIVLQLQEIANKEGFEFEREALMAIASKAGGSMRDAISILDQAILNAMQKNRISFNDVREMLKIPSEDETQKLFELLLEGDAVNVLEICDELSKYSIDETEIILDLLEHVSNKIKHEACDKKELGIPGLIRIYQILQKGLEEVKMAESKKAAFEVLLIKLMFCWRMPSPVEIIERLESNDTSEILKVFKNAKLIDAK